MNEKSNIIFNNIKIKWFKINYHLTYTVGTYSLGNESVVYDISIHVLPTVPSPTTTHLIGRPDDITADLSSYLLKQIKNLTIISQKDIC